MTEKKLEFARSVALTTCLAFTLITFFYFSMMAFAGDRAGSGTSVFTFFSYTLGKLFCFFLFSLSLGFMNRIFLWKKPRAILRLAHIFLSLLSYCIFLIWMFYTMFDANSITTQGVLMNLILFAVGYPLTLLFTAIGRRIFLPKTAPTHKSILY